MKIKTAWSKQTDVLENDLRYAYLCKHRCELITLYKWCGATVCTGWKLGLGASNL